MAVLHAFLSTGHKLVRGKADMNRGIKPHPLPQTDNILAEIAQHNISLAAEGFRFFRENNGPG